MFKSPGLIGYAYTDAFRSQFDAANKEIIDIKNFPHVVFLGDSLLWYMPTKAMTLPVFIANRGIPGDVTPYMALRFAADVVQLQPKQTVLLGGINDIINVMLHEAPYENDSVSKVIAAIIKNITTMADAARQCDIAVYIGSILPVRSPMGKNIDNEVANASIRAVNQQLQLLCKKAGYHYINWHPAFTDPQTGYMNLSLSIDGIHLKKIGYQTFIAILQEALG